MSLTWVCVRARFAAGLLDISRKVYIELIEEVSEYVQQLSADHQLALRTGYNSTRGFHIQLFTGGKSGCDVTQDDLPAEFIKVSKFKNALNFTSVQMVIS